MADPDDMALRSNMGRPGWTLLASEAATYGGFELFEELRSARGGPPPHVHRDHDEAFYVVEGRYAFTRDHDEVDLEPGGFILIPRGTRHHYRTLDSPSRTLILLVPAGLEGFFREMGARIGDGATALEAMTILSATYDAHPVD